MPEKTVKGFAPTDRELLKQVLEQRDKYKKQLTEKESEMNVLKKQVDSLIEAYESLKEQVEDSKSKDVEIKRLKKKVNKIIKKYQKVRESAVKWEKAKCLLIRQEWLEQNGLYDFYFDKPLKELYKFYDIWKNEDAVLEINQKRNAPLDVSSDKIVAIED